MSGANLPCVLRVTTDFAYVRLHGPDHQQLYDGSYSDADLGWWAERIREWQAAGPDVFVYFTRGREQGVNAAELDELAADSGRADTGGSGDTIVLSMAEGANARSCHYKLDGDRLTIDDGNGSSCIPAEPDDMSMPVNYQRAPT